ncbi:MAG TPA: FAD-binding oxidoreductase [Acidimicrobiales bacterium]|nr:FAD-binding oxidoreductase [Acidimicrobiales bacterium]
MTKRTEIDDTIVQKLATGFSGDLLQDGDEGYDDARRVYNGMFDRRPGLIARCLTTGDVAAAVQVAREHDLLVAVRGGGHSIAGFSVCDGGLMIDLSRMKSIDVDPEGRTARAQPGVLLQELDAATQAFGLATPLGFVSVTGIAGLTLNGGIGFLSRKHGLSCDNLIGAEVVLANGEVVHASDSEDVDLLWGLRGGGGNFGIVTSFEYRLHEVSEIYGDMQFFTADRFADVLRHYARVSPGLPDEALLFAGTLTVPENEMFPPELHGVFCVLLLGGYVGSEADGQRVFQPLHDGPEPDFAMAMSMPYQMAQMMQDEDMPDGRQNYWKSGNLDELGEDAIQTIVEHALTATSPHTSTGIMTVGGAIARVAETATAYSGRQAAYNVSIDNIWEDPSENEAQIAWTRTFFDALRPHLGAGAYLNFNSEVAPDDVAELYGPNYLRLRELKHRYDPTNLFSLNQNIR